MTAQQAGRQEQNPAEAVSETSHADAPPPLAPLSRRELDCLLLTAFGQSDADVASSIYISESTVRFHLRNAARKLAVSGRREAIYRAAKLGLI